MSRAARITVGSVVAGVLAFVAVVAGAMAGASSFAGSGAFDGAWLFQGEARYASAEVLDVDHDLGYTSVDVRYTTEDDEVVVTWVDWEHDDQVPVVGDRIDVVYDAVDPEWSFAADDPAASGLAGGGTAGSDGPGATEDVVAQDVPATTGVAQASGWVALGALVMLLLTVVVTVVAAVRAPAPAGPTSLPDDPFAWQPGHLPPHEQESAPRVQAPYGTGPAASPAEYRRAAWPHHQRSGVPQAGPQHWQGPS